jgi:hypothetical protein
MARPAPLLARWPNALNPSFRSLPHCPYTFVPLSFAAAWRRYVAAFLCTNPCPAPFFFVLMWVFTFHVPCVTHVELSFKQDTVVKMVGPTTRLEYTKGSSSKSSAGGIVVKKEFVFDHSFWSTNVSVVQLAVVYLGTICHVSSWNSSSMQQCIATRSGWNHCYKVAPASLAGT